MSRALITGIAGQDGRYLAEFLLGRGYEVFGLVRDSRAPRAEQVREEVPQAQLVQGDLRDLDSLVAALEIAQPSEVYNLAALSSVAASFEQPELTAEVTGVGVLRMLDAVRQVGGPSNPIKFYQASSSEMFGRVAEAPQTETSPFHPQSPYAVAKVFGHHATVNYREAYGLFACSGILFNHESPRRGREYVTRKITNAAAEISLGLRNELALGNLDARRDWGYAGDYVRAMWLMLQQDDPGDYVVATGETHSVREFAEHAFQVAGVEDWERFVVVDERFFRPADIDIIAGDATKASRVLGWQPEVRFDELVRMMVEHDLALLRGTEGQDAPVR